MHGHIAVNQRCTPWEFALQSRRVRLHGQERAERDSRRSGAGHLECPDGGVGRVTELPPHRVVVRTVVAMTSQGDLHTTIMSRFVLNPIYRLDWQGEVRHEHELAQQ